LYILFSVHEFHPMGCPHVGLTRSKSLRHLVVLLGRGIGSLWGL